MPFNSSFLNMSSLHASSLLPTIHAADVVAVVVAIVVASSLHLPTIAMSSPFTRHHRRCRRRCCRHSCRRRPHCCRRCRHRRILLSPPPYGCVVVAIHVAAAVVVVATVVVAIAPVSSNKPLNKFDPGLAGPRSKSLRSLLGEFFLYRGLIFV